MTRDSAKEYLRDRSKESMNDTFIEAVEYVLSENVMLTNKINEFEAKGIISVDIDYIKSKIKDMLDSSKKEVRSLEKQFNRELRPETRKTIRAKLDNIGLKNQGYSEVMEMLDGIIERGKRYPSEV